MIALALVLALAPAPREDNLHYREAVAAWDEARWDDAARAFAAAYELEPRPEYVFAQARARRNDGDCEAAVPLFRRFIALDPPVEAVQDAELNVRQCEAELAAAEPAPQPSPPPPRVEPAPTHPPAHVDARARPIARDPLGHALVWPGLAVLAAGTGLLVDAHLRERRGRRLDEDGYRDLVGSAPATSRAGIALASIGGAAVLAGVVRFAVLAARARRSDRAAIARSR